MFIAKNYKLLIYKADLLAREGRLIRSVHGSAKFNFPFFSTIIEKSYFVYVKGLLFIFELAI